MTLEEAIANRERCYNYLIGLGAMATPENVEAVRMSLEALREKKERESQKPLTLEQVKEAKGDIWICYPQMIFAKSDSLSCTQYKFSYVNYGKSWIAYRDKPKEV